jgi:hypothetical protein
MGKPKNIIIKNKSHRLDDVTALWYVQQVIEKGRISNKGKDYCYITVFEDTRIVVNVTANKLSDSFLVYDYRKNE